MIVSQHSDKKTDKYNPCILICIHICIYIYIYIYIYVCVFVCLCICICIIKWISTSHRHITCRPLTSAHLPGTVSEGRNGEKAERMHHFLVPNSCLRTWRAKIKVELHAIINNHLMISISFMYLISHGNVICIHFKWC